MTKTLLTICVTLFSLLPLLAQENKRIGPPNQIGKIESQKQFRQSIRDRSKTAGTAREDSLEPRGQRSPLKPKSNAPHSESKQLFAYLNLSPDATASYMEVISEYRTAIDSIHNTKNLPAAEILNRIHEAYIIREQKLQTILTERQYQLLRSTIHFYARPKITKTGIQAEQDLLLFTTPLEFTSKQVDEIKAARNLVIARNKKTLKSGQKNEEFPKADIQFFLRLREILTDKQIEKLRDTPRAPIDIPKAINREKTPSDKP